MSDVNRVDYIAATLRAIPDGHPHNCIEDLMPWRSNSRQASPHRVTPSRLRLFADGQKPVIFARPLMAAPSPPATFMQGAASGHALTRWAEN